jgi:hypothetical protein
MQGARCARLDGHMGGRDQGRPMATILDFRQGGAQQRSRELQCSTDGTQPATGELIFFPGVRYERSVSEPVAQPTVVRKRKARGRAHDQINLPD